MVQLHLPTEMTCLWKKILQLFLCQLLGNIPQMFIDELSLQSICFNMFALRYNPIGNEITHSTLWTGFWLRESPAQSVPNFNAITVPKSRPFKLASDCTMDRRLLFLVNYSRLPQYLRLLRTSNPWLRLSKLHVYLFAKNAEVFNWRIRMEIVKKNAVIRQCYQQCNYF